MAVTTTTLDAGTIHRLPIDDLYRILVETSPDGIYLTDPAGTILYANQRSAELQGFASPADLVGRHALELVAPEDRERATAALGTMAERGRSRAEYRAVHHDGTTIPVEVHASVLSGPDGLPQAFLCVVRDLTERQRSEELLERLALYDALTELPNRTLFRDRLDHALATSARTGAPLAVLVLDLDRFKEVNDTLGHGVGDLLLRQIGPRLQAAVRDSDTVARLGGDEFAILLPGTDRTGALQTGQRIVRSLQRPIDVTGHTLDVGASIGMALAPDHGKSVTDLLRQADVAMYVAKRTHAGCVAYTPELDDNSPARLVLAGDLRRAIGANQLVLHYQPVFDAGTGRVDHVEALLRWHHPQCGLVLPAAFIPLAEQTGLIKEVNLWLARAAMRQVRQWHEHGIHLPVAINLSARGLHDPRLRNTILRLVREHAISPSWLVVEITESVVMAEPERSMETLGRLRDLGIRVSIDDFGTGYSSLAYLQRLPVDEIKIDRSFVHAMRENSEDGVIVRSIVDLGHSRGLRVVGEGVEDAETLDGLRAVGCDLVQGYYLGRPVPPEELETHLHLSSRSGR